MFFFIAGGGPVMMTISLLLSILSVMYSLQDMGAAYRIVAMMLPQLSEDSFKWLPTLSTWLPTGLTWVQHVSQTTMVMWLFVMYACMFMISVLACCRRHDWGRSREETWSNEQLQARVHQLPIETWIGQDGRAQATIKDLRARLERRGIRMRGVKEKTELVSLLESAPHDTLCSICYEDFENGDPLRLLRCGHYFHIECARLAQRGDESDYRSASQRTTRAGTCPDSRWRPLLRCIDRWLLSANGARAPSCPLCSRDIDYLAQTPGTGERGAGRAPAGGQPPQQGWWRGLATWQSLFVWLAVSVLIGACWWMTMLLAPSTAPGSQWLVALVSGWHEQLHWPEGDLGFLVSALLTWLTF